MTDFVISDVSKRKPFVRIEFSILYELQIIVLPGVSRALVQGDRGWRRGGANIQL